MLTEAQKNSIDKEVTERAYRDLALHDLLNTIKRREQESEPGRLSGSQALS